MTSVSNSPIGASFCAIENRAPVTASACQEGVVVVVVVVVFVNASFEQDESAAACPLSERSQIASSSFLSCSLRVA